jgi:hypothetical protein
MKKILAFLALACLASFATITGNGDSQTCFQSINAEKDSVYICYSATAHVYHASPGCSGLNHCTHRVIKVSLWDAINKFDRRACKLCER